MKERHWISLVSSLRHGKCVLVLGHDIPPAESGGCNEALARKLASELEDEGWRPAETLPAVAQQYEDHPNLGRNSLRALAARICAAGMQPPSEVHKRLAALPFSLILTTCYDDGMRRALQDAGKKPIVERYHLRGDKKNNPEPHLLGSPDAPLIYHLFGNAKEPTSLVLSENDLLEFVVAVASRRPPLPNSLRSALRLPGQGFLFVGFGIKQWYLRVLHKVLVRVLDLEGDAFANEPLRSLSDADRQQIILFYQRGRRMEVEDDDIAPFLARIEERIEKEGGLSDQPALFGVQPRVFISYAREDRVLAARVCEALRKSHFDPWFDKESLQGGDDWDRRIREGLAAAHFALVFYTPALCKKRDSYVNKEIEVLVRDRAPEVRGRFLIPLTTTEVTNDDRIAELQRFQEVPLREDRFDEDMQAVISTMLREYQRRSR